MKKTFWLILFIIVFSGLLMKFDFALAQKNSVEINFFYSAICPHCAKEKEFLDGLKQKHPEVQIKEYEVFYQTDNQKILNDFYNKYNVPASEQGLVPATFTPAKYFVGYTDKIGEEIESCIKQCLTGTASASQKIKIPILGEVDALKISLPVLTLVLGVLDGFNPCAMWVLVILISLLLAQKSRKQIALVGGIFIFAEGLLYFLFMSAWLNFFLFMKYVSLTRILIGIFGIGFGILRIRDFISWKPGVCKVVDHSKSQEKIMEKIQRVLVPAALPATVLGIIILAFSVNLVEFFCSAGFPIIYTKILAVQNVGRLQYYLYLLFYNTLYMLDDLIVFGFAFFTLSRLSFSDKYNRYSTIIAGILIFILGLLLIFKPEFLMFG